MDRLTTGRRHIRAGSVTVTELLSRQASPPHCSESTPSTPDDDVTDTIPVVAQATHRRAPARGAQLAKLASLGVAGVVLCGAVTISSLIADQRREAGQSPRPVVQITGEQALLPDQLDETVPEAPDQAAAPEEQTRRHDPEGRPAASSRTSEPSAAPADGGDGGDGTIASGGAVSATPDNDVALVREFYGNLPDSPVTAFGLLSPELLGMDFSDFLASWKTVTEIDGVEVAQRADGVLATVRMRLSDGGQLRIQQLLTVAESPRRIVGAQLLSAQRG